MSSDIPRMPASYDDDISREPECGHVTCEHGICKFCGDGCESCEQEKAYDGMISRLVHDLHDQVTDAERRTASALKTVIELTGSAVYDIELAEGHGGSDAVHELQSALRHLRNAGRIADWRLKLLEEQS